MICHLYPAPEFFIFSSQVPDLLYYSHIPAAFISLVVGILIFLSNPKELQNKLLLIIFLSFTTWASANLILWTNIQSSVLLFAWSFLSVSASFISIFSIYFIYVYVTKKDIPIRLKILFALLLAPVLIFAHTNISLSGFDITACDAFNFEGFAFKLYHTSLEVMAMLWIAILLVKKYLAASSQFKKQILLMGVGIESFLFSFFTLVFLGSYLAKIGFFPDSRIEMFGMFGMIVFVVFIGILIIRFRAFSVGLVASQGLVMALVFLIGSQFAFLDTNTSKILVAITLILTAFVGIILIRTVRKEIDQRQQIENLAKNLEKANVRLQQIDKLKSEFVSIASHQLRSPITSIAGYASLLREGNFGKIPAKMEEPLERIQLSARLMAESIEDYLNVSQIEAGNMKFHNKDFNLKDEVEHFCDDLRPEALRRGLILLFRTDMDSSGVVNCDLGKVQQITHNLVNNAIKYTKKGTITVVVRDSISKMRIYVDILDTGIGMDTETLHSIFQKFERGDKANLVNVKGTGLGLYVAQKMAEAMGGTVTAQSKGEGKGSLITLELPLQM